jgi:thioredoxin 1
MFWKRKKRAKAQGLTKETFSLIVSRATPSLVFFEAPWCGACKILHPIVDDLADENGGREVNIAVVNVDKERELSQQFGIRSLPTLVVFQGGEIIHQGPGMISKPRLQEMINKLSKKKAES